MDSASASQGGIFEPAYARFWPRVRALYIDVIVLTVVMVAALVIAVSLKTDSVARVLGFTVAAFWLLYEPLLVSFAGGTIGHRRTNLRVVDNRTRSNVSFLKAVARTILKGALGWVSFVTMLTTRRSQAVHDLVTRSTVQIRDQALAGPRLYIRERQVFANDRLPSRTRRIVVIIAYILGSFALFLVSMILLLQTVISNQCALYARCSRWEDVMFGIPFLGWIAVCLLCAGLGWRGRLYGCRAR